MRGFGGESGYERMREQSFSESERLLAIIVEAGVGMDPQKLAQLRGQLDEHLKVLGVLDNDGKINIQRWMDYSVDMFKKKSVPIKPEDYPSKEVFSDGLSKVRKDNPNLFTDVSARGDKTMNEYLYGVGIVMSNRLVYESVFKNDPIVVERSGKVENGRHRFIAREVLNEIGYDTTGWNWVVTELGR